MMTLTVNNEATITVLFKYVWNIERQIIKKLRDETSVNSPAFGPEDFDLIKFKLQLHYNEDCSKNEFWMSLILVSSIAPSLNCKYKVILNDTSNSKPVKLKKYEFTKLSIGQQFKISKFKHFAVLQSIHCEFKLNYPYKVEQAQRKSFLQLAKDVNSLRLKIPDATIAIKDIDKFKVNKNILSARSPVFAVMLSQEGFMENAQNRVDITDIDEKVVEALLDFIYTAQVKQLDEIAPELLVVAHRYDIKTLIEVCAQSMMKSVTKRNVVHYLMQANLYNLDQLKHRAIDLINRNSHEVTNSEQFKTLIKQDNGLMHELYLDFTKKYPQIPEQ